jgi:hypothetical protein
LVPLAAVVLGVEGCSEEEGRANARLMAAAPDMLAVLKAVIVRYGIHSNETIKLVADVIARAEGKP